MRKASSASLLIQGKGETYRAILNLQCVAEPAQPSSAWSTDPQWIYANKSKGPLF